MKYLPWVMSAVTITQMYLAGSQKRSAWALGLANQVLWVAFSVSVQAWGLLPLSGALVIVYTRNWIRWGRKAA